MHMIWHDRPCEVKASTLLLNPLQARYNDGGLVWIIKVPMALVSDGGDRVDVPQLRPAASQETWTGHASALAGRGSLDIA
jgi:hypothetical protein